MYNHNGSLFEFVITFRFSQIWKQMGKSFYSALVMLTVKGLLIRSHLIIYIGAARDYNG